MDQSNDNENSSPDVKSITVLLERAKSGCDQSREHVFEQLQNYLEHMAARYSNAQTLRKAGVSDIVQLSFVKVVEKFDTFRGSSGTEFRAWLKTLVMNEARQMQRGMRSQRRDVSRERSLVDQDGVERTLNAAGATPGSAAIRKEQLANIESAIAQLPKDYETVIRLRNFEHKEYDEIAKLMNRSKEAVTKLWYRAILKLQQTMLLDGEEG